MGLSAFGNEGGGIADGGCGRQAGVVRRWWVLARVLAAAAGVIAAAAGVIAVFRDRNEVHCGDIRDAVASEILLQTVGRDEDGAVEEFGMRLQVEEIAVFAVGRQTYGHVLLRFIPVQAIADDDIRIGALKVSATIEFAKGCPSDRADNHTTDSGWGVER